MGWGGTTGRSPGLCHSRRRRGQAQFNNLLGNGLPFDRHDWIVHRGEGSEDIHYVIDYYNAKGGAAADGIGILVDVKTIPSIAIPPVALLPAASFV